MIRLNEISYSGQRPVDGYGPGFFRIAGALHEGAALVLPGGVRAWAGFADMREILEQAAGLDVLLVGTGAEIAPLPPAFRAAIEAAGVGVEPMSSPAACRSYNLLLAEARRIGAALLPV